MTVTDDLLQHVDTAEVARIIKRHPDTVRAMIRDGQIPAFRVGNKYRVRIDDLRALMQPINVGGDEQIRQILAEAPPLTDEQVAAIVEIIRADRASA